MKSIYNSHTLFLLPVLGILMLSTIRCNTNKTIDNTYKITLTVTSNLPSGSIPMDPVFDFEKIITDAGLPGVLDPNSITIFNQINGQSVPFALSEDFAYNDRGRLEWAISDSAHKIFEIRFRTTQKRPSLKPRVYTPLVGVGDLLRYNANEPRPIGISYPARLIDLTGDGNRDLVGCWNYAYRPGWPWDGIICYPREGDAENFEFGDMVRIRYVSHIDSSDFKHFSNIYMFADFADLNHDNLPDIVYCPSGSDQLFFYLNSGKRDTGGMPIFVSSDSVPRQTDQWNPCRAVDLDQDGAVDFVIGDLYLKNTNPDGWPVKLAKGVSLNAGKDPCFYDVNGDKKLDAICLEEIVGEGLSNYRIVWKENLGGDSPKFASSKPINDINPPYPRAITAVNDGPRRGLLIGHRHYEKLSFFEQTAISDSAPRFEQSNGCKSISAVMALSDQAWPYLCDWDNDGDLDLLVGGGYGWPRILINEGSNERMAFSESKYIFSEGKPIRLTRNQILGGEHWHNMGYSYPVYTDWDSDGLPDLMLPNETNRIFWYKNIGTLEKPQFGPRLQIICDGYPDSPEFRSLSARRAIDTTLNTPYPHEKERPFMWRIGAAFADWNNDGLMDFITHDGYTHKATLFTQYYDTEGTMRVKKDYAVTLTDGRLIDDKIVNRISHWTESFKATDWDADGLTDLIYTCSGSTGNSSIYLLRNVGTKSSPVFEAPRTLSCYGEPIKVTNHGPHPWIGDMDGDDKPDVLTCVEWSVFPFFSHNAIEMESRPTYTISAPETVKKKRKNNRPKAIKQDITIHGPEDRPDRLVAITGLHSGDHWSGFLVAEYSLDSAVTWQPATIYPGTTVEQWRSTNYNKWNRAVQEGDIPAENNAILWNYFFDLPLPVKSAMLRLRDRSSDEVVSQKNVNFKPVREMVFLDHRNIPNLCASGALPDSWSLATSDSTRSGRPSIHCTITDEVRNHPEHLILQPELKGWYRIYIGMERYGTCKFWLSGVNARFEIPNYLNNSKTGQNYQLFNEKEYYICSANMTGQDICISPGGARKWHDTRIQNIRLVPMTPQEVAHFKQIRQMAHTKGRPFAGYLEPCTPGAYAPESLTLQEHLRNEVKLNQMRGSTDLYVHAIRIGSKAWYHSDVVERFMEWGPGWPEWMRQGDPMAVVVDEARKAGLKIFADAGMNSTYYKSGGEYHVLTERFTNEHPDYLCADYPLCFDYRNPQVQAYVTSIIRELLMKYDVDGVNLDFGRWGYRKAYDAASLVAVLEQVDLDRKAAAKKWGHPVLISARIDYDAPTDEEAPEPLFLAALRSWAKAGLVDRIMVNVYDKLSPSLDLSHYLRAIEGTQTQFWGDLYQGTWYQPGSPAEDFRIARAWAEQGVNGGFFYYQRCRPTEWEQINWRMRLIDFPELQVGPY